ncbi:hypothetical protein LDENG_00250390 [Lucifuga dentata]|nr:hypothetical protein LDENG_00250390 [Lucifuga dentata]
MVLFLNFSVKAAEQLSCKSQVDISLEGRKNNSNIYSSSCMFWKMVVSNVMYMWAVNIWGLKKKS